MKKTSFLSSVIGIALPVGLQSMLQSSFSMIDQLMVGQLGTAAVSAVEVAGRPAFIYSVLTGAVAAITGIMISQYLGMKDADMADRSLSVNLVITAVLAALFSGVCFLLPEKIVGIYVGDSPEIRSVGGAYLSIILWTYLPMGMASILAVMIRCMDKAVWPLAAGITSAVVNTGLNYVLIFGHLGVPPMGITGAAIASVVSQLVNLLLIAVMFCHLRRGKPFRIHLRVGRAFWNQYLTMLWPLLVTEFLWSLGQNVNTFIYGHMAPGDLAAMSMTGPIQGLFIGALCGVSQAAGILIGKRLGAGEYQQAYGESKKLVCYGLAGSLLLSGVLIALRGFYVTLYNVEPQVQDTAQMLLLAFAILAPVKVANMILGGGVVRSGGKTAYIMVIDAVGTWLVGVPLGLVTAFVFHMNIFWVYFILSQEELVRLIMTAFVFKRGGWMNRLETARE